MHTESINIKATQSVISNPVYDFNFIFTVQMNKSITELDRSWIGAAVFANEVSDT